MKIKTWHNTTGEVSNILFEDITLENAAAGPVAGIDEAGRGPWAGPVVSAAVILPNDLPVELCGRIDDSKKLNRNVREALLAVLDRQRRVRHWRH